MTRFHTGQKVRGFPDQTWNRLVDRMLLPRELRDGPLADFLAELQKKSRPGQLPVEICPDFDMVEHGIAIVDSPTFQPELLTSSELGGDATLRPPMVDVVAPTSANVGDVCVVSIEPIKSGEVGLAIIRGLAWARVDVQSGGDDKCGPVDGEAEELQSGTGEFDIVWRERAGETGKMWCLVMFSPTSSASADELRATFSAYTAPGSSGNTYGIITATSPIPLPTGAPSVTESPLYLADIHEIGPDLTSGDPVRGIRSVGIDTLGGVAVNWECNLDGAGSGGGSGDPPEVGCGLEYVADVLLVDYDALAGQGIKVGDSSNFCDDFGSDGETYCCLYIEVGCGLQFNGSDGDVIEIDMAALAGKGLTVGSADTACNDASSHLGPPNTYCCLQVNIGCGLKFDESDPVKIAVDLDALAGSGLGLGSSSGDCYGVTGFDGSCDCLKVNVGCGLDIVNDDVVVDNEDLAGVGLSPGTGCALDVNYNPSYFFIEEETGYLTPSCNPIKDITCTLEQDSNGDLKLTINFTFCDDTTDSTSCTLSGTTTCGS
jgi:hypothetical protein